eukprot:7389884-Prymnesium_polylepis.1
MGSVNSRWGVPFHKRRAARSGGSVGRPYPGRDRLSDEGSGRSVGDADKEINFAPPSAKNASLDLEPSAV